MVISHTVTEFKAHCLQIVEEVATSGLPVQITKRGKPAVLLIPASSAPPRPLFGWLEGSAQWSDDLFSTEEQWEAEGV